MTLPDYTDDELAFMKKMEHFKKDCKLVLAIKPMQSRFKEGEVFAARRGIYGGKLNLRRRATVKELDERITHYEKQVMDGTFCKKRAAKIIAHFERLKHKMETRR